MKLHKLRKVDKAGNVIRLTFKKFFGGTVDRDVIKSTLSSYWEYMDTGEDDTVHNLAIAAFIEMDVDCYTVNVGVLVFDNPGMFDNLNILGRPMARPPDRPRMTVDQIKDSEV
jgi:hypothetical protein